MIKLRYRENKDEKCTNFRIINDLRCYVILNVND